MSKEASTSTTSQHVALYRKYRPESFADVRGQDHIVKVLEGSLASGRIAHAYLFSGSRGTGKTTFARIFAHALKTTANDIYEIDAASNRGIDDIRAIRDAVNVLPLESPYKVYIVDEVHMLTKEAFNALLKTLEEPPKHVIFILATTEIDKLPETVVSRCQTFSFRKPSREILRELISSVAKKEGFVLEAGVADLIALLGDGSFRDALGTLQKVVSSGGEGGSGAAGKKISLAHVELVTGAPKNTLVNDFLSAIAAGSAESSSKALSVVAEALKTGIDMKVFVALVLEKARFVLLLRSAKGGTNDDVTAGIKECLSEEDFTLISSLASEPKSKLNSVALVELLHAYDETDRAHIASLPLELAVVKICDNLV